MTRLPRHRRFPAVGVALVALGSLVGCGIGGGEDSSPTTRARVTTSSTGVATTTPGGTIANAAPGGTTTIASAGASRTTTTTKAEPAARTNGGSPPPGVVATRPGRYRYASTGTFSAALTGEQRRSGESILTVDVAAGADQRSVRQGDNRSMEQVGRYQPDGIYLVMFKVTEQGITKEFRAPAPVLAFPYGAAAGRTWSWRLTSTDNQTTVDANFRIDRTESVPVGAESVAAVVVQATLVTTGDVASRATQTLWVAEPLRLVVREASVTEGTFGAISFRSTADERLLSLN